MTDEKTCYNCGNKNCNVYYSIVKKDYKRHFETYEYQDFDCVNHDKWEELKVEETWTDKMTDEKRAEEDCNNEVPFDTTENDLKCAYLAGLKAGKDMAEVDLATVAYMQGAERYKPKWHKVSEQIPTEEKNYLVILTNGTIDVMAIALDGNLEPYLLSSKFDFYRDVDKWCEIPEE